MSDDADEQLRAQWLAWFERYMERIGEASAKAPAPATPDGWFACPCCGHATLSERGGYEICPLCDWEDDGQDAQHADEVWGGPNGAYALATAQENVRRYGTMYAPSDQRFPTNPAYLTLRGQLAAIYLEIAQSTSAEECQQLRSVADQLDRQLLRTPRQFLPLP